MEQTRTLAVLVPRTGTYASTRIDAGSGIVADVNAAGPDVEVYYEGNRYGAENLRRFEERVTHAAGRLVARYPTIAKGHFPSADFHVVGLVRVATPFAVTLELTDEATARAWAATPW